MFANDSDQPVGDFLPSTAEKPSGSLGFLQAQISPNIQANHMKNLKLEKLRPSRYGNQEIKLRSISEMIHIRTVATTLGLLVSAAPAAAADIVVGVPDWPSAAVTANIIADVLEKDFGVDVELKELSPPDILEAIDRGDVQIHPEIWLPNLKPDVDRLSKDKGTLTLSERTVPAKQNICVTSETKEFVGIDEVADLKDPDIVRHFDTDGDGKGEMWIGAPEWASTSAEKVRAKSYGYDKTMNLLEGPESIAMAAVDVAAASKTPIVFYCYSPHYIFELHDVQVLDEPPFDAKTWSIVSPEDDKNWLDKSFAESAWDASSFQVGYATSLKETRPEIANFLAQIVMTPEDAISMSYAVHVERKTPEEVADAWIDQNAERIKGWLK